MKYPQYRVICKRCGNSSILNRGEVKVTGRLWWKKTNTICDSGKATCRNCYNVFEYDINNNVNCYPTAVGISPLEVFHNEQYIP